MWPRLAAAILGAFIQGSKTLVGKILLALGISYVTYSGIQAGVDAAKAEVITRLTGLPQVLVQIAAATKVDVAVSILFSAIVARLLIQGLTGGSLKKMVLK